MTWINYKHGSLRIGITIALAVVATTVSATDDDKLPQPFEATYSVSTLGAEVARSRWQLQRTSTDATLTVTTESSGLMALLRNETSVEQTRVTVRAGQLSPAEYSKVRSRGGKDKLTQLKFDWSKLRASGLSKNYPAALSVPQDAQDPLAYLLKFRSELARDATATQYDYPVADAARLQTYSLRNLGSASAQTAIGTFDVIKFERHGRKQRVTTLWCARALEYLPVRIDHVEKNGQVITLEIQQLRGLAR